LAIAIAYRAIQNGFDAFSTTAATLIDDLSAAFRAGQLAEALQVYTHPAVLVVDEVGYLTHGTDAATMLFSRRQRAASPTPVDDLYDEQGAQGLGPRAP
jgi:DNA replication protein DnaC